MQETLFNVTQEFSSIVSVSLALATAIPYFFSVLPVSTKYLQLSHQTHNFQKDLL